MTKVLELSEYDESLLSGDFGEAPKIAMRILTRIAKMQNARELLDISHVHIGGSIYTGKGSLTVIERFVEYGARVTVPTTINAISVDKRQWRAHNVDEEFAKKAIRLANGYERIGASSIFSCTPYVFPEAPQRGQDIVWAESNAITFANSVIGARANRHGDFLDTCAAITGRAPKTGLHISHNRNANFLVEIPSFPYVDDSFYTALGYLIGQSAGNLIPVIQGIEVTPSVEELKLLCAAASTSGAVGLIHIVGVTPEAPTLKTALDGKKPHRTLQVTEAMLHKTLRSLTSAQGAPHLDLVVLGSPHFTLGDFYELAQLTPGRKVNPHTNVLITTSRFVLDEALSKGWAQEIERFGAQIRTDTCLCMLSPANLPQGTRSVMTNSGKFAHYGPGLIRQNIWYGSLEECINSAERGVPVTRTPRWLS